MISTFSDAGAERFVIDLCNELARRGHEVTLISFYPAPPGKEFVNGWLDPAVRHVVLGKRLGLDLRVFSRLWRALGAARPDVVHTHLLAGNYNLPSVLLRRRARHLHTVHTDAREDNRSRFERALRRFLFRRGLVQAVTISRPSDASFRDVYGASAALIPNGRALPAPGPGHESIGAEMDTARARGAAVLVAVGRLAPVKNHAMLARAVERLRQEGVALRLYIVGDAGPGNPIAEEIGKLGNPDIVLTGSVPNPFDYLVHADAFCLSSHHEGAPISLLEAQAAGLPCVCTPVGGIPDVVTDGENGILASAVTDEAFAGALRRFLGLRGRFDRDAIRRTFQEQWSMERCADRHVALYQRAGKAA